MIRWQNTKNNQQSIIGNHYFTIILSKKSDSKKSTDSFLQSTSKRIYKIPVNKL